MHMMNEIKNCWKSWRPILPSFWPTHSGTQRKYAEFQAVSKYQQELSLLDTSKPYAIVDQEIENIYEHARRTIKGVGMLTDHMFIALYNEATHRIVYRLIYEDNRRIDSGNSQSPSYRDRQLGEYQDFTEWLIRANERRSFLKTGNRWKSG